MNRYLFRGSLSAFLVAVGLLLSQPGTAQAQPDLVGRWSAPFAPTGIMTFVFGPGEFIGHAVWRGPLQVLSNNCLIATGTYEIRMFTGTEGTLGIMDGACISNSVGNIDMGARIFTYKNVRFRPDVRNP